MHSKSSVALMDCSSSIFEGLGDTAVVERYYSLAIDRKTLPPKLRAISETPKGEVMDVEDPVRRMYGLQFHSESVLTSEARGRLSTSWR